MKTYELTYIISSEVNSEEAESVKNEVGSLIQSKEGVVLRSEKLGAQPLSYLIKKQSSGYFNIETFQIEENKIKEIKDSLDKNTKVLRSAIVVKKPVKIMQERRTRKPLPIKDFDIKKKPSIMDTILRREPKKEEKVDTVDLEKKLDEILSE